MKTAKRLLSLIMTAVLLALSVFSALGAGLPEGITQPNTTVLGDSIASGYGLENLMDSYGALIAKDKSHVLRNDAVPGHTTADLLWVVCHDETARADIGIADLILISIGGNDIISLLRDADTAVLFDIMVNGINATAVKNAVSAARENVRAICEEIRAINPDAPVIFQTQYNPLYANDQYKAYADMADKLAPSVESIFESATKDFTRIYLADVYSAFNAYYSEYNSYDVISSDGIHPSAKGHKLIADVLTVIINQLEELGILQKVGDIYYLLGDSNNSGTVTVSDATLIQKHTAGMITFTNELILLISDTDQNGTVNIRDATAIQKHIAGLIPDSEINTYLPYFV